MKLYGTIDKKEITYRKNLSEHISLFLLNKKLNTGEKMSVTEICCACKEVFLEDCTRRDQHTIHDRCEGLYQGMLKNNQLECKHSEPLERPHDVAPINATVVNNTNSQAPIPDDFIGEEEVRYNSGKWCLFACVAATLLIGFVLIFIDKPTKRYLS